MKLKLGKKVRVKTSNLVLIDFPKKEDGEEQFLVCLNPKNKMVVVVLGKLKVYELDNTDDFPRFKNATYNLC